MAARAVRAGSGDLPVSHRTDRLGPARGPHDSFRLPAAHSDRVRPRQDRSLGALAGELGARRALVVSDPGIVAAGHTQRGLDSLVKAGISVQLFDGVAENPTTDNVEAGVAVARAHDPELIVGLGGGSSMDCAKGINFLYTNGGRMQDYWGVGKATRPMLPMIAVPTTAGTGSETQSFALISDAKTHVKMACGDKKASFRVALLDPELTVSQPPRVTALTGIDAIAHALETYVTQGPQSGFAGVQPRGLAAAGRKLCAACCDEPERSRGPRAACSWARALPAWRSKTRCSARRTPWPIR